MNCNKNKRKHTRNGLFDHKYHMFDLVGDILRKTIVNGAVING